MTSEVTPSVVPFPGGLDADEQRLRRERRAVGTAGAARQPAAR